MTPKTLPVQGFCPMGCGETLILGDGGHVTCSWLECPNPGKADDILHDRETEHIMRCDDNGFTLQHPLRERGEDLFQCPVHDQLARHLGGPPNDEVGDYRVRILAPPPHDPTSESFRSPGDPDFEFERIGGLPAEVTA